MGDTRIEWTEKVWNPFTGCTKVSEGCKYCYAERIALRLKEQGEKKYTNGFMPTIHKEVFSMPLRWKEKSMIFVNSMSDLFHESFSFDVIDEVFDVMYKVDWHTYQILTKRSERMLEYYRYVIRDKEKSKKFKKAKHIWLGVSVENSKRKYRIEHLSMIRKEGIKFVSFEPLLEDVGVVDLSCIHWIIIGGEHHENARVMRGEWVENLIRQAREQNVKVFFKQWGGNTKCQCCGSWGCCRYKGEIIREIPSLNEEKKIVLEDFFKQ